MRNFLKKPVGIITISAAAILIILIFSVGNGAETALEIAVVARADIAQEVSVTGTVKPAQIANLAFEKSGTIARVYAQVGDKAASGQTLVALESGQAAAQLAEAEADLKVQEAKLAELARGTRSQSVDIQSAKVAGAVSALEDAEKNLADKRADALTKAEEAIRGSVDQFFSQPDSSSPQLVFTVNNFQLEIDIESQRFVVEATLDSWQASDAGKNLLIIKSFLDKAWASLSAAATSATVSVSDIAGWKSDVFASQTNINTAISNLTTAIEKLKAAQSSLDVARRELTLDLAGTASEPLAAQKALVDKAAASRDYYRSQLYKTVLRAPFRGVITRQDAEPGEIAPVGTAIVSLISQDAYEIEANVPEADIAKVNVGDTASATLDAYGSEAIFGAKVIAIDPAETMIEGVATYKVKLQFNQQDERVRSGMTANIEIVTAMKQQALVLPQRAITHKDGGKFARILEGEVVKEVPVKIGIRGSDGKIEILEGLTEGQQAVISAQ